MKRLLAIVLSCIFVITGCMGVHGEEADTTQEITFSGLSDPALLEHIENDIYQTLETELEGMDYTIESIDAVYISEEYLEELMFNSRANNFFGYSLKDLDEYFSGTRYVFTLDEEGETTVKEF